MASAEYQKLLDSLAQNLGPPGDLPLPPEDVAVARQGFEDMAFPLSPEFSATSVDAGRVAAEWVSAPNANPGRRLLYLHGGGYVTGSINTHRELAGRLSQASGCVILVIDYRMAPEHPFPAAVEDTQTALRFMRENGPNGRVAAEAIFVGGDSAGGGLALSALIATRDAGERMPDAAVTLSAWTDLANTAESIRTRVAVDPLVSLPGLELMAARYLSGADPESPLASPLYADLSGLPPLLMQVGDAEIILDDTTRFAQRARDAGVEVTERIWPEMCHIFPLFAPAIPEGQQGVDEIGEFLRQQAKAASASA